MRPLASAVFVSTLLLHSLGHAQESQPVKREDRLFLSAGYGWSGWDKQFKGLHVGAEYQLTPVQRRFGLRVHVGAFWTPTQSYSVPTGLGGGPGSTFEGFGQVVHFDLGVTGSIVPWPRARVSPYVFAGPTLLQRWSYGSGYYRNADGSYGRSLPPTTTMSGEYGLVLGTGLRVRAGGRLLLFEIRKLLPVTQSTYSVGTALHF